MVESYRARIMSDANRMLSKNRVASIRYDEYVSRQPSAAVQASLKRLFKHRDWRYVSFAEFSRTLYAVARRFFASLRDRRDKASVCFVVDSLSNGIKSSFWVFVLMMLYLTDPDEDGGGYSNSKGGREATDLYSRLWLAVDDEGANGGLYRAFSQLSASAPKGGGAGIRLVLVDDATYSGDQLSRFLAIVKESWRNVFSTAVPPRVTVIVPFMSLNSIRIIRGVGGNTTKIVNHETFAPLFHGRPLSRVLSSDLYLEGSSRMGMGKEYQSLYFDVLGILPTNSLFLFEHKVADQLSIPDVWLKVGPCVSPKVTSAYRLRPSLAAQTVGMVRRDIEADPLYRRYLSDMPGTDYERMLLAASLRIKHLIASSKVFREKHCERVALNPRPVAAGSFAADFFPLIAPEFCDAGYKRFMRFHRRANLEHIINAIPPCRTPPYKHDSFPDPYLSARIMAVHRPK